MQREQRMPPRPESNRVTPETQENPPSKESLHEYLERLSATGKQLDTALVQYRELLLQLADAEKNVRSYEQRLENETRRISIQARYVKLAWATIRHVLSSSIVGSGIGAATYYASKDPALTVMASAAGALLGSAAEVKFSQLEQDSDRSREYFENHHSLGRDFRAMHHAAHEKELETAEKRASLNEELASLQNQISSLDAEIERLVLTGNATFRNPSRDSQFSSNVSSHEDTRAAVQRLSENLRTAGERFNNILVRYAQANNETETAKRIYRDHSLALDQRKSAIAMRVATRQIWDMIKKIHMTLGSGGIVAMGAYVTSLPAAFGPIDASLGVLGTSLGGGILWFTERYRKNIAGQNIPVGQYERADHLAQNEAYQAHIDPALKALEAASAASAEHLAQTQKALEKIDNDLEAFMQKYPMGS